MQPVFHDAHQHLAQNIPTSETAEGPFVPLDPYPSSTQLLSPIYDGPVPDNRASRPAPSRLVPDWVNTARIININADAGQHSHAPVAPSSSNQNSAAGPSHRAPTSPERKRLLPWSAEEEHPVSAVCIIVRHSTADTDVDRTQSGGAPRPIIEHSFQISQYSDT